MGLRSRQKINMGNKHIKITSPVNGTTVFYSEEKAWDEWDLIKQHFKDIMKGGGEFNVHVEVYDPEEKINELEQKIKELEKSKLTIGTIDANPWQDQPWNLRPLGTPTVTYKPGDTFAAE